MLGGLAAPGTPPTLCLPSSPFPCMWENQSVVHGLSISYTSLHPHGGVYTHPAMSLGLNMATRETEARPLEGSGQGLEKASNGSLGNAGPMTGNSGDDDKENYVSVNANYLGNAGFLTRSCGDGDKATSGSANDDPSPRCDESGGEEFSKNSRDDEINPCDSSISGIRSYDQMFPAPVNVAPNPPATTKGMDLWNHSQDEREQRRQKRKLSNRESARRSRERKQKECEDFSRQVAELNTQNSDLRAEIDKLNVECKKLEAENTSIVEELKQLYGPGVLSAIEGEKLSMPAIRILGVECNGHGPERSNLIPMVYENAILLPTSNGKAQ